MVVAVTAQAVRDTLLILVRFLVVVDHHRLPLIANAKPAQRRGKVIRAIQKAGFECVEEEFVQRAMGQLFVVFGLRCSQSGPSGQIELIT